MGTLNDQLHRYIKIHGACWAGSICSWFKRTISEETSSIERKCRVNIYCDGSISAGG